MLLQTVIGVGLGITTIVLTVIVVTQCFIIRSMRYIACHNIGFYQEVLEGIKSHLICPVQAEQNAGSYSVLF